MFLFTHDCFGLVLSLLEVDHVKLRSERVTQNAIPDVLEVDHVKLCSQPVTQSVIPDVLEADHVKPCSEPVTQSAIPDVFEVDHVKLCLQRVLRNRDQIVIDAHRFLLANFQGMFGPARIKNSTKLVIYMWLFATKRHTAI